MSKKRTVIYFVTWPDGNLVEGSQTSVSESMAVAKTVQNWLPSEWFPALEYGEIFGGGVLWHMWPAMKRGGFKVHSMEVPTDKADGVSY